MDRVVCCKTKASSKIPCTFLRSAPSDNDYQRSVSRFARARHTDWFGNFYSSWGWVVEFWELDPWIIERFYRRYMRLRVFLCIRAKFKILCKISGYIIGCHITRRGVLVQSDLFRLFCFLSSINFPKINTHDIARRRSFEGKNKYLCYKI